MSAADLVACLAVAARAAVEQRPDPEPKTSPVAIVCPGGVLMCVKPYTVDEDGYPVDRCSSKPAHHDGPCGPWMPEIGFWNSPPPRDSQGRIVNLDELDYGMFGDPT